MSNAQRNLKRKFYILSSIFPLIVISFILYAQYTNSWGKKFQELDSWHTVIQAGYAVLTFCYLYFYYRFVKRHKSIFGKKKKTEPEEK